MLNDSEKRALDRFCDKYGVKNRSKLIRETLMKAILKQLDRDQPTLFD
jgi:metal-responsive CopG/Arc/MetJ family transcriptional regulator